MTDLSVAEASALLALGLAACRRFIVVVIQTDRERTAGEIAQRRAF